MAGSAEPNFGACEKFSFRYVKFGSTPKGITIRHVTFPACAIETFKGSCPQSRDPFSLQWQLSPRSALEGLVWHPCRAIAENRLSAAAQIEKCNGTSNKPCAWPVATSHFIPPRKSELKILSRMKDHFSLFFASILSDVYRLMAHHISFLYPT